jgi:hypothetical protein
VVRSGPASGGRAAAARRRARRAERRGALLSVELLLVLPILAGLFFGVVEFGLLLLNRERVEAACHEACRVATHAGRDHDPALLDKEMRAAAEQVLAKRCLVRHYRLRVDPEGSGGDRVAVELRVPMKAAAPDLLKFLGITLEGRQLVARSVMRKE